MEPFKHKCPNCGKETVTYNPEPSEKDFCGEICRRNYKYGDKFIDDRYFENTPLEKE